ncbi:MAG: IPT/TIG domain-containing protein [Chloroflexi bacterium]|nr:IPT/TIG domain-containing protein [Chloroflexota bacterium]
MQRILNRPLLIVFFLWLMVFAASSIIALAAGILSISPTSGPPGTSVTITAPNSSFAASETGITITYDITTQLTTTSANSTGGLSPTIIIIPASASGPHTITATGSANSTSANFTVTPTISSNPSSGIKGSSVTVAGSGFGANETGIRITFDGTAVGSSITANAQGSWSSSFVVPDAASGSHTIDANGTSATPTLAANVPDLGFTVTPSISANRANAAPGASVTITGAGFGAGETGITVTYDGTTVTTVPPSVSTNTKGGWTASFVVPASPSGSHTIDASGPSTAANSVPDITFTTSAGISANPANAAPGSSITITGSGFSASETGITVTYDGNQVASVATADPTGGWKATFVVPASAKGAHTIDASGSTTLAATIADLTFTVAPSISIGRTGAAPGSSVAITGTGFGASETGITITYDGTATTSAITADATGGWKATFVVPASPSGSHTIDASSAATPATAVPDQAFTVTSGISANPPNAAPGSSITITGAGFGASETGITVTYDEKTLASGISANAQGGWSATFTVPASTSGSHSIKAQGSVTPLTSLSETGFNIGAGISANPASSYVGGTIDITGSGFASRSPLKTTYDNKEIASDGITTDESGSFTRSITIPQSKAGNHTIRVVDGQNNDSSAAFTMENTPPPAPSLISPGDGDRLGIAGDIKPTLKWSGVTDPSGVVFNLQVATDPDFSQRILEKTAIPGSRYILTAAEALPRGEYYWRVKAIDGASNESAWSQTWALKSGLMPLSALITIVALVLAAAAGLTYYLRVVRRPKRWEGVPVPEAAPPQPGVVSGQWRLIEPPTAAGERDLPWRLALPQPEKGAKTLSTEQTARLKVIVDFAQSLPLVEPGYTAKWLLDVAQNGMGAEPTTETYRQILEGELQVRYEPSWLHHPIYQDLSVLLEGQPILQDLNAFVDAVNRCAAEATSVLQQIYGESVAEISSDFLENGGWSFISAVYSDAVRWFLGKSLREPSERDYVLKPGEEAGSVYLWGEENTSFAEPLIRASDEKEAQQFRLLHLRLRRSYRNSDKVKQLVDMMTQMAVQRDRLSSTFSQFDNFTR